MHHCFTSRRRPLNTFDAWVMIQQKLNEHNILFQQSIIRTTSLMLGGLFCYGDATDF